MSNGDFDDGREFQHAPGCSWFRAAPAARSAGECDCFNALDYFESSKSEGFEPATEAGPSGGHELNTLTDAERTAMRNFASLKNSPGNTRSREKHKENYGGLFEGEIRVLELYSGGMDTELRGDLHVTSINFEYPKEAIASSVPNASVSHGYSQRHTLHGLSTVTDQPVWYTALSYVWGPPIFDVTFQLQYGAIQITRSLARALQYLRAEKHSVFLWIDQICINQKSVREKEQQIPLMGLVYSHATNTLIWLGDEDGDDPSVAFKTLADLHARMQMSNEEIGPDDFSRLFIPRPRDRAWWQVKQILRRPWFTRLWTIQEALLPLRLFVRCGRATIAWEDFAAWTFTLIHSGLSQWLATETDLDLLHGSQADVQGLKSPIGASTMYALNDQRQLQSAGLRDGILDVLASTRYAQASEQKDKVYGVLGIVETDIIPNYSQELTIRQLYQDASLAVLRISSVYRLLSCVDHENPLIPSWVPDWSASRVTEALCFSTKSYALYSAGGHQRGKELPRFTLSENRRRITIPGKIIDEISQVGCIVEVASLDADDPTQGNKAWGGFVGLARGQEKYPSGASVYEAFWRTLVANKSSDGLGEAPSEYDEVFSLILDSSTGVMPSLPGQMYSVRRQKGFFTLNNLRSRKPQKVLKELRQSFRAALQNRRFAVTQKGYFALLPRGAKVADSICVFDQAPVPFLIRKAPQEGFQILGETYVHGIMHGEVMTTENAALEQITLV
ncbi:heterokaryon incompatibility protein-domain-containing protein [Massariosphaeria phaeospora]|uniref:Heterokaryon incompatibility protein-domain-containing protein n=1 Tax=Massariosphaeria phaeospora TaxID=100035 RepID=A0A7C8I9R1_9PLEO|nr:heterokaryon incompatibility protein-domain-containing protein [Massariosphaeria phaeospora]